MIKLTLTLVGALVAIASLNSCATMKGVGQDVQNLGQKVENSADRNR